jgi:hypothetical protein
MGSENDPPGYYQKLSEMLTNYPVSTQTCEKSSQAILTLLRELRSLVEEVERAGDYDSQFGIGRALDRAWSVIESE